MYRLLNLHLLAGALFALCLLTLIHSSRLLAQTPPPTTATTPIPANTDWDQETQNAVNAINTYRTTQQPALPALQVDAILQNVAAWMANNQFVTKNCLGRADQGVINCNTLDTLVRDPGQRLGDFGYQGGAIELFGYDRLDGIGDITMGQGVVDAWTNSTRSTTPNQTLLSPNSTAIGIARQCQTFGYGFACIWWAYFGTNLNQAFAPAAQAVPPAQAAPRSATVPTAPAAAPSLTGTWTVDDFGSGAGGTAQLVQTNNQVTGTYSYDDPSGCGAETGTVTGTINGTVLTIASTETGCGAGGGYSGPLTISADGQSLSGGTVWNATRAAQ